MRAIDLALKDLTQLVRDWKAAMFLVVMPVVFTFMFGFAFGGFGGETDPRLPVGFLDQDGGSVLSTHLLVLLDASDAVRPAVLEGESLDRVEKNVRDEKWAAAVVVPAGYSEQILAGGVGADPASALRLTIIAGENTTAGAVAQSEVQAAVTRLLGAVQTAQLSAATLEAQAGLHPESVAGFADESARRQFLEETLNRAIQAWKEPSLTVAVTESQALAEDEETPVLQSGFSHTSPSMMVQFAMAGLIGAAEVIVLERKSRALQRLLTTAISHVEIILGHFLAMFVTILLQFVLLIGFGQFVLRVDYLREPLAVLLVTVTMALWTASLGLLIGVLAKTQDQVIIFSLVPMFVLAGLGGAWVPLEFTGQTFQTIGHLMPTAWAMDGFENIVIRGLGLNSVLLPAGILLAYAVVFFVLAVWRFRFE